MEFSLNAEEILSIIEEVKLNGVAFYKHLARYGTKGEVRKVLVKLVEIQEHHAMCFAKMRSHLSEYDKESTVFHRGSDEWMYLREMAGHHVFEVESDQKVKSLTSAIEPIILLFLGVGVAFLVISIIMPIYNLTTQI